RRHRGHVLRDADGALPGVREELRRAQRARPPVRGALDRLPGRERDERLDEARPPPRRGGDRRGRSVGRREPAARGRRGGRRRLARRRARVDRVRRRALHRRRRGGGAPAPGLPPLRRAHVRAGAGRRAGAGLAAISATLFAVRRIALAAAVVCAAACAAFASAGRTTTLRAATAGGTFTGLGFDTCTAPSLSALGAWLASPYRAVGIYVGGVNRACGDGNLSASWVTGAT